MYCVFDIGGSSVKNGILDGAGNVMEESIFFLAEDTFACLINELEGSVKKALKRYTISGIAISSPGAVDSKTGWVYGGSSLKCIHEGCITNALTASFGLPVTILNDANCALMAEYWIGAAKGYKSAAAVVTGSGIGGAVIQQGSIQLGNTFQCGEFGYMVLEYSEGIHRDWSDLGSVRILVERVNKKLGHEVCLTGKEIFALAKEGNVVCKEEVERFYEIMAIGIFNVQYVLDPEVIVLGGAVSEQEDFIVRIEGKLKKIFEDIECAKVFPNLKKCLYGNKANLIGALFYFLEQQKG